MNFNKHSRLEGLHAFLSASRYHWVDYDEDKLASRYMTWDAAQRGVDIHSLACLCIKLGVKLPRTKHTLNSYVNDAIGFKMNTEVTLYYSENCFGTADAISFRKNILRIHDLKTGKTRASIKQLLIYNALFCLEYGIKPSDIESELRLYQLDEILVYNPEPDEIYNIMDKIIFFDKRIEELKIGG